MITQTQQELLNELTKSEEIMQNSLIYESTASQRRFRSSMDDVPIVDVEKYLNKQPGWEVECEKVADSLHKYGILIFKDPRAHEQENEDYIELMEKYFEKTSKIYYDGQKLSDAKPEYAYQTGVTPEQIEKARNHYEKVKHLPAEDQPRSKFPPTYDMKWRYMWKIGERPPGAFDECPQVVPEGFPDWEDKMTTWGEKLLNATFTAAEMAAQGMKLDVDTFSSRMKGGAHLLAPTGSDLKRYDIGTTLAGFHYDIALLTCHGKSRYPGLYIWLRDWTKVAVKIPKGCLLIQAGSTFEHITGGYVLAGYHEVIYSEETKAAALKTQQEIDSGKDKILWRVSSTLFSHMRFDTDISPMAELSHLYDIEQAKKYRKITAYEKLMEELSATSMIAM
ncbi:UNKNOWN [Stylonychia lemnae]|uniref:Isopenicillin N synthase-like Fe(2+) 2OG dioxygenase domain-containing protein n=1 Tax=Stylonychia lemnae TaxID=5949 RepID=A0A078AVS9_STYLE|nr:UNKNOWN [Stylonychia lemnae]|eukprot:CDW86191.1 UNKNOWN [Stylonychia lemnae]